MVLTAEEIIARVTEALRRADSEDTALAGALETICRCADLSYGEVWSRYLESPAIYLKEAWHPPELDLADFVTASKKIALALGVGLPGRVWQSGRQEVIRDLRTTPDFSRQSLAIAAGFCSAVATPVIPGDEVCAVLVFLTPTNQRQLPALIRSIAKIVNTEISERRSESSASRSINCRLLARRA